MSSTQSSIDLYKVAGLPLIIILFAASGLLMQVISDVRLKELKISLQNVDQSRGAGKSLGLVARYQLIRKRYGRSIESAQDYLQEGELMAVLSGEFSQDDLTIDRFQFLEAPAIAIVNFFSLLTGAKPIREFKQDRGHKLLETAYFYERKRQFAKAVQVYQAGLKHFANEKDTEAYIRLHRGFCLSLLGDRDSAIRDYEAIIKYDPNSEMGLTAEVLISFLRDVGNRLARVERMRTSVRKGEAYYRLMAYSKAIDTLDELAKKRGTQKLYFYRGRSYEEIGKSKEAVKDYRRAIKLNPRSQLARNANRRLYMLGAFYEGSKSLKKESSKNAVKLRDTKFIKSTKALEGAVDAVKVASLPKNEATRETLDYVKKEAGLDEPSEEPPDTPVEKPKPKKEKKKPKPKVQAKPKAKSKPVAKKEAKPAKPKPLAKRKLTDPTLSKAQRKEILITRYKKVDKVFTQDGNVFVGAVIRESPSKITIATVFGVVKVPQDKISMRLKVKSKQALK